MSAEAATVNATWNAATDVAVTASSYTATGNTVNFTLNFAPATGTNLTVVKNTGLPFISGTFSNLTQGQRVNLSYSGAVYPFVANYYGGTGNDLVLVCADTRLVAWGSNANGQLGNNTTTDSSVPVPVTSAFTPLSGRTVIALSSGGDFKVALCSDGTLLSWGSNTTGQLGNVSTVNSGLPMVVPTAGTPLAGKTVVAIGSGAAHSVALCSDGTLVAWGNGWAGQLGQSVSGYSAVPLTVTTAGTPLAGKTVVSIAVGSNHNLALCSDGTLVAWGYNQYMQLGNGNQTIGNSYLPVAVTTVNTVLAGKTVVGIAAGANHCLVLCSDGTLASWGYNGYGQLGNNGSSNLAAAVDTSGQAIASKTVIAVASGGDVSMALCSDGTVSSWGYNGQGQLGNNSTVNRNQPGLVNTSGVLAGKAVDGFGSVGLVKCTDGTAVSWGSNSYGALGNNSTDNFSIIPVAVSMASFGSSERFTLLAPGIGLVATPLPAVTTLASASVSTTTAVLNGTVNANGGTTSVSFDYGLDTNYGSSITVSSPTVGTSASAVSATLTGLASNTTYHFRISGTNGASSGASYKGADFSFTTLNGNLSALSASAGTFSPVFSPTVYNYRVSVGSAVSSVAFTPTVSDSRATTTINGVPIASGSASSLIPLGYGDNAINITVTAADTVSTVSYTLVVARAVPAAWPVVYAAGSDVPVSSNGFTATGGTVNFSLNYAPVPGTILTVVNNTGLGFINGRFSNLSHGQVVNLSYNGVTYPFVASYHGGTGNDLVLIWAGSRTVAWGYNSAGQLGNSSTTSSNVPVSVTTAGTPMAGRTPLALSAGYQHSLALFSDGSMASWGYNVFGQLGNNTNTDSGLPQAVTTAGTPLAGKVVVAVAAGYYHNLVLCSDGTLAGWGYNADGELGNNTTGINPVPVAVTTSGTPLSGKNVVAIGAGYSHSLALCSDGMLSAWGSNFYGQLGCDISPSSRLVPVAVTTAGTALAGKTVVAIAVGQYHNIALCSDGSLVSWGQNDSGQLGNGTTTSSNLPLAVTTAGTVLAGKTVIAIGAGYSRSVALCSDGTLAAWGGNGNGELGNNNTTNSLVPVAVSMNVGALTGKTVVGLAVGASHSLAKCSDGTAVAWGYNGQGQLGIGSNSNSQIPVAVSTSAFSVGERPMLLAANSSSSHSLGLVATPAPAATTLAASTFAVTSITATSVVLNGLVHASGGTASVSFDYGLTASYGQNVAGTPTSVPDGSTSAVSVVVTGLAPSTTYHFRVNGTSGSSTANGADLIFTTSLSPQQYWWQQNFGTTVSTGITADIADYDGDGIPNLLEYALNLSPKVASKLPVGMTMNGANFEYTYTRSTSAVNAGTAYTVEWNPSLSAGSWSSAGVTQTVLSDDGATQQVKAVIPVNGNASSMFVHLSVTAPP